MPSTLIVDNDLAFSSNVRALLESQGHTVTVSTSASVAISEAAGVSYDLIIISVAPNDTSGLDLIASLRAHRVCATIIVLSSGGSELDCVVAFRRGADDFMYKPISVSEFMERVNARLRHVLSTSPRPAVVVIDSHRRRLVIDGQLIDLTRREFQIVHAIVTSAGSIVTKQQLMREIWHTNGEVKTRTVDFHIANIRRKLAVVGLGGAIRAVHGTGVVWNASPPQVLASCHDYS